MSDSDNDKFTIELDVAEGFALRDAITLLGLVADGDMEAAQEYVAEGDAEDYVRHQVERAQAAHTKIAEGQENTGFTKHVRKLFRELRDET